MTNEHAHETAQRANYTSAANEADTTNVDDQGIDIQQTGGRIEEEVVRTAQGVSYVQQEQATKDVPSAAERRHARARNARRVIYFFTHSIVIFTAIRLVLQALGADPNNGFFTFLRIVTGPFVAPFSGLFREPWQPGYDVSELSMVVAMIVFYLMAWIAAGIAGFLFTRPTSNDDEDTKSAHARSHS